MHTSNLFNPLENQFMTNRGHWTRSDYCDPIRPEHMSLGQLPTDKYQTDSLPKRIHDYVNNSRPVLCNQSFDYDDFCRHYNCPK